MKTRKHLTPLKAIRQLCLRCCSGSAAEVRRCQIGDCPGHLFRLGKNPYRKGVGPRLTRGATGRFLVKQPNTLHDFHTNSVREGLDTPKTKTLSFGGSGEAGARSEETGEIAIERDGKIKIQKAGNGGLVITLTQGQT